MADYSRPPGFEFTFGGVNLRSAPDALAPNEYACAQNIRAVSDKSIQTRPGYVNVFSASAAQPITDVRAYSTLGTDNLPRFLCRDSQNHIIIDSGPAVATLGGSIGSGACMIAFRPNNSPQSWMYICGLGDYRKFSAPNPNVMAQKVGIAEPQSALDAAVNAPVFTPFIGLAANWTVSGTAGALTDSNLLTDTAGVVIADPALSSRLSVGVTIPYYSAGMLVTFGGANTYPVEQVWQACATSTITAIRYDSGTTGLCSVVASVDLSNAIGRGSLVTLNTETVLILSVTSGPNGTCVFRCSTSGAHAASETITGVIAIVVHGTVTPAQAITVPTINSLVAGGIGILSHTLSAGVFSQYSPDDYIHITLLLNNIAATDSITFVFDVSGTTPTFTNNVLTHTIQAQGLTSQLIAGEVIEVHFPISALSKTPGALNACLGIQLQFSVTATEAISIGGLWVGGGGEPDVGRQGAPYRYRAVPRSAVTGAKGNASPSMRYGVTPLRQSVTVKLISAGYDPQIDTWDIERYGGTVLSWRYIGSVPSTAGTFTDNYFDNAAGTGAEMETDNFEPWPSIDLPYTVAAGGGNTITVTGTSLEISGPASWPSLIAQWMPGTLITIAGLGTYTLRARPVALSGTSYLFELEECAGSYSPASITIAEPKVARASVPYMWGPNEQGNIFAVGDPMRPGSVYYCKPNNPDSAPDKNNIELSPPSEPLIGGEIIGGISLVASTKRWWALYPSFSYTAQLTGASQGQQYTQIEQAVGRGLVSPYGHCSDGQAIWFFAKDCIAMTSGGGFKSLTDDKLYSLFPHEGVAGQNITRNGVTFYAPDYSRAATFRLARASNYLYADYEDSTGTHRTMVCDVRTGAWSTDIYHDAITVHYAVEQQEGTLGIGAPALYPVVVMGDTAGNLWKQQDLHNDNLSAIPCVLGTFEWDGGDKRANGFWGDLYIDCIPVSGLTATPTSLGNAIGLGTSITASAARTFAPVSMAGGALKKYVGLQISWTDNYITQSLATVLRAWQPSIVPKPETITDRFGDWDDAGIVGAKYFRAFKLKADTFNFPKVLGVRVADDSSLRNIPIQHNGEITKGYAFSTPFVGHLVRDESQDSVAWRKFGIEWVCDPWPELTTESTAWLKILPNSGAAFLQGLIIPIETGGAAPALTLRYDSGVSTVLTSTVIPTLNVKTPVAFSLPSPVIAHQVQIVPTSPCRLWVDEIQWLAQPTPELATTWKTPFTGHGLKGYHSIPVIDAAYSSQAAVTLTITAFDGTSPAALTLSSTAGVYKKVRFVLTPNKGLLFQYSAVSSAPFQIFLNDCIVWLSLWGRESDYIPYRLLGAEFGEKAPI